MKYIDIKDFCYEKHGIMGSEAFIYKNNDKIFKKFLNHTPKEIIKNKTKKLLLLENYSELQDYYNKVDSLVYDKTTSNIVGYLVEKINGLQLYNISCDLDEKINILKELQEILNTFKNYNIDYLDVNLSNVFYTNNHVKLIDIDNIRINEHDIDILPIMYKRYYSIGGYREDNARIFVFNLMSLLFLLDKTSVDNIKDLNIYQKELNFLNKEAKKLCNDLLQLKIGSSCDNEYLIDKILIK